MSTVESNWLTSCGYSWLRRHSGLRSAGIVVAIASGVASATATYAGLSATEVQEKQTAVLFGDFAQPGQPGCALGVMRDGRLISSEGYGLADLETHRPITADTVFNIASMSKQFTAFSILLLWKQGRLSLDDSITRYVPELAPVAAGVTLRELLHHNGGVRDYVRLLEMAGVRPSDPATEQQALQVLARQKSLNSKPGSIYAYSNSGYFLLGLVVQRLTGQSLKQFETENIFRPLEMTSTTIVDRYPTELSPLARGYAPDGKGGFRLAESLWTQVGDGQVYTTITDMALWDENLYSGRVGGPDVIRAMTEPGRLADGELENYAAGLFVGSEGGLRTVFHSGSWVGYRSMYLRFPDQHFSLLALCNRQDSGAGTKVDAVAHLYLASQMDTQALDREAQLLQGRTARMDASSVPIGFYRDPATDLYLRLARADGKTTLQTGPLIQGLKTVAPKLYDAGNFGHVVFVSSTRGATQLVTDVYGPVATYRLETPWRPKQFERYTGQYWSEEAQVSYNITSDNGHLTLREGSDAESLEPAGKDEFVSPEPFTTLSFRQSGGRPSSFIYSSLGVHGLVFRRH